MNNHLSQLQDPLEQLNAIFELSPDGFVSFDAARRVNFANPAFTQMTRIGAAQLSGLDEQEFSNLLASLCKASGRFKGIENLREKTASDGTGKREIIELALAGKRVLEVALRPINASSVSQILYFRDVTHEDEVDKMKSEFLNTAAHELRTPMANIYGFAELLLSQKIPEASRHEILVTLFKQTELMAHIVQELIDLARIEARHGKDFIFGPTHVQAIVTEVTNGFMLPEGRGAATLVMPADPLYIIADRAKLLQAIQNVLSNAYTYSPPDTDVWISIEGPSASGASDTDAKYSPPMVAIGIVNQGDGMHPEQLHRVCERFYRADSSGMLPGAGLGMSIVKEIVDLHHGRINIDSQPGQGASVTLQFPLYS
jgi:signal transduction histidine kinase